MKPAIHPPPIVTFRGFVYPWQLDHNGHMNAQFHAARYDEASWQLLARLGCGPRRLLRERRGFVALEQKIAYQEDVPGGTVLHVESELLQLASMTLRVRHRLCDSESQRTLSTMELTIALIELDQRRTTVALPPELVRRALAISPALAQQPAAAAPLPAVMAAAA